MYGWWNNTRTLSYSRRVNHNESHRYRDIHLPRHELNLSVSCLNFCIIYTFYFFRLNLYLFIVLSLNLDGLQFDGVRLVGTTLDSCRQPPPYRPSFRSELPPAIAITLASYTSSHGFDLWSTCWILRDSREGGCVVCSAPLESCTAPFRKR